MGVYFLTVHGRSLSVSDRYRIADSEAADFTGSVRSNFGWIVRPLIAPLLHLQRKKKINQLAQHQKLLNQRITINILRECIPKIGEN